MARLTLNSAGVRSPLDVGSAEPVAQAPLRAVAVAQPPAPPPAVGRLASAAPTPRARAVARAPAPRPFFGAGRGVLTALALDARVLGRLEDLARAGAGSQNALVVAALAAGLPDGPPAAGELIVSERVRRAGAREARVSRPVRLPEQLRARLDELVRAVEPSHPRARGLRADLINALLASALPQDAQRAAELVREHARRVELAAGGRDDAGAGALDSAPMIDGHG